MATREYGQPTIAHGLYRFLSWPHNVVNGLCRGLHCGPDNGVLSTLAQAPSPVKFQPLWQPGGGG